MRVTTACRLPCRFTRASVTAPKLFAHTSPGTYTLFRAAAPARTTVVLDDFHAQNLPSATCFYACTFNLRHVATTHNIRTQFILRYMRRSPVNALLY